MEGNLHFAQNQSFYSVNMRNTNRSKFVHTKLYQTHGLLSVNQLIYFPFKNTKLMTHGKKSDS